MTVQQELEGLRLDAIIELFELVITMADGSINPVRWCNYADVGWGSVSLAGVAYTPWAIRGSPIDNKAKGTLPQFSVEVADFNSTILALIDQNRPFNAPLTVRRIYAKHLDGGSEPNSAYQFTPLRYTYNYAEVDLTVTIHFTVRSVNGLNTEIPRVSYADLQGD